MIIKILYIAIGGSLGSILRFSVFHFCKIYFRYFPVCTLLVNILGSFFIGLFVSYLNNKEISEIIIRYFFIIGFLGSFTTFSAFSKETFQLIEQGNWLLVMVYILFTVIGCLLATWIGMLITKN